MTTDNFPLVKQAGLEMQTQYEIKEEYTRDVEFFILAADIEAWLEKAPVVYCGEIDGDVFKRVEHDLATHTARLVCVEEIVKDTAESLLREFADLYGSDRWQGKQFRDIYDRARKLLEGE